jgi:hypothetical protein
MNYRLLITDLHDTQSRIIANSALLTIIHNMTNTNRPALTADQTARYHALRAQGHTARRALEAARVLIGGSAARRGPRGPRPPYVTR